MSDHPEPTLASYAAAIERLRKSGMTIEAINTLANRFETAQKRAQERGAPQEVHILIGAKAEVDYIRLIENFERVSDRHSRSGSDGHKQW